MRSILKIILLIAHIILIPCCFAQNTSKYRIFFTSYTAQKDSIQYGDDEFKTIQYTVRLDLNGDGIKEEFISEERNCGSGGCPWALHDGKTKEELGGVDGAIIYILKKKVNGFPLIETYWKMGAEAAIVYYCSFQNNKYIETRKRKLDVNGIKKYFQAKPPISEELKELN
jgi:hypothetical protein